ncbi:MAG: T9SS type A sorting domain-containing protein [Cyclobacteriaceae bacterium]|nr:T9SS type A sorting domain-containing protein [Cyclobacteriaceae bacterium]
MKRITFFLIFSLLFSKLIEAQDISNNNYSGSWTDNNSWNGGSGWSQGGTPATLGLPDGTARDITIQGYIEVGTAPAPVPGSGNILTFSANKDSYDFIVNDTLVVYGDVDFANKSMNLVLGPGAVFIVFGNLDMNNKIDIASSGTLVVSGNFNKSGSQGSYTGTGNVYAGSFSGDAENTIDSSGDSSFIIDQLSDDGFGDIENFVNNNGTTPLPIELLYFVGEESGSQIVLKFATAMEENFDYFAIEKAYDGVDFETIGEISGSGNSSSKNEYSYLDTNPEPGLNYYRLRSVDLDGTFEFSETILVKFTANLQLEVSPNPSSGRISLRTSLPTTGGLMYNMINQQGMVVIRGELSQFNTEVDLSGLPKGIYIVRLLDAPNSRAQRIVLK